MKCIRCRQGKSLEWEKSQIRLDKEFRVEIYVFIYSPIPLGSCCNVNFSSLISCDFFYFLANDEIFFRFLLCVAFYVVQQRMMKWHTTKVQSEVQGWIEGLKIKFEIYKLRNWFIFSPLFFPIFLSTDEKIWKYKSRRGSNFIQICFQFETAV